MRRERVRVVKVDRGEKEDEGGGDGGGEKLRENRYVYVCLSGTP
jgi:hypothetical protein